jgi:endonuclease YncB( thermonuclease family)
MLHTFRTLLKAFPVVMMMAVGANYAIGSASPNPNPNYIPPKGSGTLITVRSGDTLHVSMLGSTYVMQIRHIRAPINAASRMEYGQAGSMTAQLELDRLCRLVGGGQVHYEAVEQGDNGILTADIECAGVNVATYMLEKGHAWAMPTAPEAFKALQNYAKSNSAGLWGRKSMIAIAPWEWERQAPSAVEQFKQDLQAREAGR